MLGIYKTPFSYPILFRGINLPNIRVLPPQVRTDPLLVGVYM